MEKIKREKGDNILDGAWYTDFCVSELHTRTQFAGYGCVGNVLLNVNADVLMSSRDHWSRRLRFRCITPTIPTSRPRKFFDRLIQRINFSHSLSKVVEDAYENPVAFKNWLLVPTKNRLSHLCIDGTQILFQADQQYIQTFESSFSEDSLSIERKGKIALSSEATEIVCSKIDSDNFVYIKTAEEVMCCQYDGELFPKFSFQSSNCDAFAVNSMIPGEISYIKDKQVYLSDIYGVIEQKVAHVNNRFILTKPCRWSLNYGASPRELVAMDSTGVVLLDIRDKLCKLDLFDTMNGFLDKDDLCFASICDPTNVYLYHVVSSSCLFSLDSRRPGQPVQVMSHCLESPPNYMSIRHCVGNVSILGISSTNQSVIWQFENKVHFPQSLAPVYKLGAPIDVFLLLREPLLPSEQGRLLMPLAGLDLLVCDAKVCALQSTALGDIFHQMLDVSEDSIPAQPFGGTLPSKSTMSSGVASVWAECCYKWLKYAKKYTTQEIVETTTTDLEEVVALRLENSRLFGDHSCSGSVKMKNADNLEGLCEVCVNDCLNVNTDECDDELSLKLLKMMKECS